MIKVIYGKKGSGKTKRIIDMANQAVKEYDGDIVFIDDDNRYMLDLLHEIRFVNAAEYAISNPDMLLGFISGVIASNYDLSLLFLDGFLRIINTPLCELGEFFANLTKLSEQHNLSVVISCTGDPDAMPEFLSQHII